MAYLSPAESMVKTHEFFDALKTRAIKHLQNNGILEHRSGPSCNGDAVTIDFIRPPPPKRYTFTEAYAMMKQGKWMRSVNECKNAIRFNGADWEEENECNCGVKFFESEEIEGQWVEHATKWRGAYQTNNYKVNRGIVEYPEVQP